MTEFTIPERAIMRVEVGGSLSAEDVSLIMPNGSRAVELTFAGGASIGKYRSEASGVSFPTDHRLFARRRELIG